MNERKVIVIPISDLVPGMIAARDIYSRSDQLLIAENSMIDEKGIAKITFFGVLSVPVFIENQSQIEDISTEVEGNETEDRVEVKKFTKNYENLIHNISDSLNVFLESGNEINGDQLIDEVGTLLAVANNKYQVFEMIHYIKNFDDETYRHSLNVSMLCSVFAEWLGMDEYERKNLTLCGIVHDIGKLKIEKSILCKAGRLTDAEYKLIKEHPVKGYELLRNSSVSESIKKAVLLHHERSDGSGYPFGLTITKIDPYAAITAIADVFEAMTANRVYRKGLCPFEVIRLFEQEGKQQFNPIFLVPILQKITDTYLQHDVILSNGMKGKIILINPLELSRPSILTDGKLVDLSRERKLNIIKVY